jgi:hypothetical protein
MNVMILYFAVLHGINVACGYRMPGRTTIDIPGTVYRLRANPSALSHGNLTSLPTVPLPDASPENMDWNSLVAAANRAFEGLRWF